MTTRNAVTIGIMVAVMAIASAVLAAPIVHEGTENGCAAPRRPDPIPIDLQISIESYSPVTWQGDPSTKMTTTTWISQPGTYDFSDDPNLANFIASLSDLETGCVQITLSDRDGYSTGYWGYNSYIFRLGGSLPSPYEITGIRLNVTWIDQPVPERNLEGGVGLRFDTIGVPEPTTLILSLIGLFRFRIMRKKQSLCC